MRRTRSYPRCISCGHSKRTHSRGYYSCRCSWCSCQRYEWKKRDDDDTRTTNDSKSRLPDWDNTTPSDSSSTRGPRVPAPIYDETKGETSSVSSLRSDKSGKALEVRQNSFSAFCDYALADGYAWQREANQKFHSDIARPSAHFGKTSWSGSAMPLRNVKQELLNGWPEGVARMRETLGHLEAPTVVSVRRRGMWADQGDSIDMPRLYQGDTDTCWRTTRRASSSTPPRIRIAVDFGVNAHVDKGAMFFRGAAACALSEALSSAGYTVQVETAGYGHGFTEGREYDMFFHVIIKEYDAPFVLPATCAQLAHIAAFRRIGFAAMCRAADEAGTAANQGLGSWPTGRNLADYLSVATGERLVVVPDTVMGASEANTWLKSAVETLENREPAA